MKPLKIAILSCNHGHAKGYYDLVNDPLFDLVGVSVAPGAEALNLLDPSVPRYNSDEELYAAHPDLEAVIIASDNKRHLSQVKAAAERGIHIFSMKIPSFLLDEYREMIEAVEKAGVVCQIELEMRNHAPLHRVKELIDSGAIGDLLSVSMTNYSHNPVWWRPWQCDPEESFCARVPLRPDDERFRGGALADHPHIFDMMRYITGQSFDKLYAEVAPNLREGIETEDMVRVIGKMKNGVIFSIDPSYANDEHKVTVQVDWEKYPQCVEVYMSAVGTKGTIIADLYGKTYYCQRGKDGEYMCNMLESPGVWNRRTQEFHDCIRYGIKPTVDLRDHYESIVAMLVGYDSITTGQVMTVDAKLDI